MSKRLLISAALPALTFASPALAIDPGVLYGPPSVPAFYWTGFYLGGNLGYSGGDSASSESLSNGTEALAVPGGSFKLDGIIGGGEIGYNWQISNWVVGVEVDIQASGQNGSTSFACQTGCVTNGGTALPAGTTISNLSQRLDYFGTIRGRAGVTVIPTVLLYATAGLAYGQVETGGTVSGVAGAGSFGNTFGSINTNVGWTVGAGVEAPLWPYWTGKLEYIYVDLGTVSAGQFGLPVASFSSHVTDNILRVGLNYKFY
jgi:outer membrane immunogenic protein